MIAFLMVVEGCTDVARGPGQSATRPRQTRNLIAAQLSRLLNPPSMLVRAERFVVARCLNGTERIPDPRLPDGRSWLTLAGRPLSVQRAHRVGYGFRPQRGPERGESPASVGVGSHAHRGTARANARGGRVVRVPLPDRYVAQAPRRGCLAQRRRSVYGSVRNFLLLWYGPQVIRLRLLDELGPALREPEVQRAAEAYAACMREAGYRTRSPRASWLHARQEYGTDRGVTRDERRMAVWDARCQRRSAIYETISASLIDLGWSFLLRSTTFIGSLTRILARAVSRARQLLRRDDRDAALARRHT